MGQKITLEMMDSILLSRFELLLYEDKTEEMRHVVVFGPKRYALRAGIGTLCERIGLAKDTTVGSLFLTEGDIYKRSVVSLVAHIDKETLERIGQMVINGEIPGEVSLNWAKGAEDERTEYHKEGGGGDAGDTV